MHKDPSPYTFLFSTDYEIDQVSPASAGQNTHMYGKKLLYSVDASPIVPQITMKRLVDNATFFVANSAACRPGPGDEIQGY